MPAFASALLLGIVVLAVATLVDVRRDRSTLRRMLAQQRDIPGVDADTPPPERIAADHPAFAADLPQLTASQTAAITEWQHAATPIDAALASEDLATHAGPATAVVHDALVLVVDEPVGSMRELLPVAGRAVREQHGLLVAAPAFPDDVLETLRVNLRAGRLAACAVVADADARAVLCTATGARVVARADLQAGATASSIGRAPRVVATLQGAWVGDTDG